MSPLVHLARRVHVKASNNWIVLLYIAVVVTLILAWVIDDVVKRFV